MHERSCQSARGHAERGVGAGGGTGGGGCVGGGRRGGGAATAGGGASGGVQLQQAVGRLHPGGQRLLSAQYEPAAQEEPPEIRPEIHHRW